MIYCIFEFLRETHCYTYLLVKKNSNNTGFLYFWFRCFDARHGIYSRRAAATGAVYNLTYKQ